VKNIFTRFAKRSIDWVNVVLGTLRIGGASSYNASKATKLSTVFRCVNLLSDAIASLPMNPYTYRDNWKYINYDSGLYNVLNVQPNAFISAFMFKKMIICDMLLKDCGSAYIYIDRDVRTGRVISLSRLDPDFVRVEVVNNDIFYYYSLLGANPKPYDKSQIIHLLNYSEDGVTGRSTLHYAADCLGVAYSSETHASNFWQSGASLAGILRPKEGATMNTAQAKAAKTAFMAQIGTDVGGKSGGIVVLGDGLEYQPISINPKDSQLLESRQFNVIEICRFFNVPPSLAFSETGKFSTAEQQSIDFLNNSLTPLIEKIESEFFRKLFLPPEWNTSELKFDVENIMRLDAVSRADYYSKMHQVGGFTTNEIREKLNANFPVKGGNRAFIQVNLQPTDALISEQTAVNPDAPVDKQVKGGTDKKDATTTDDVQKLALNGAQISSLVLVAQSIADGTITKESAKNMIAAAFPSFTAEQIAGIVDSIEINENPPQNTYNQ